MENKELKQTTIDWLIEQISKNVHHTIKIPNDVFDRAKKMHREEITSAWVEGNNAEPKETTQHYADIYYNKQFKQKS